MFADWPPIFARLLLDPSLRLIAVAAAVGGLLVVARVRSSATRHAAWTAVLAAMLLMPALPYFVPALIPAAPSAPFVDAALPPALPFEREADLADGRVSTSSLPPQQQPAASTQAATTPPVSTPDDAVAPPFPVWRVAIAVYLVVSFLLLLRFVLGWLSVRRILRMSGPDDGRVVRSPLVSTPVTVGPFSPVVIVPSGWDTWPEETRRAVMAHELAHAARRDPLVTMLAHLNRCVFWFHPLAWWLERKLAILAEDACDEVAVREVGENRRYAEVLLEMAANVSRRGRRLSWQGVGVDGTGLLGQRIDRVLRGNMSGRSSRALRVVVAASCAATIFAVFACRRQEPQQPPAQPLQPNPEVTARIESDKANAAYYKAVEGMTAQQVADLEAAVAKTPEDLDARKKLLAFYRWTGPKVIGWNETLAARRRHVLWLIEHHPENALTVNYGFISARYDPAGRAQAAKLWLTAVNRPDASIAVLGNAAYFFSGSDKPMAEKLLLRAQEREPGGPQPRVVGREYRSPWTARLGRLYASAIVGDTRNERATRLRAADVNVDEIRSPFAQEARKKLDGSNDPSLLLAAGSALVQEYGDAGGNLGFDPKSLGIQYLERAHQLKPDLAQARSIVVWARDNDRYKRAYESLKDVPREKWPAALDKQPDAERLAILPFRAETEYMNAEFLEYTKKDARAAWERSRRYAEDALKLAEKLPNDPSHGRAIFSAHMTLACLALRDNDKAAALEHVERALDAPPSDELRYSHDSLWMRMAVGMLKRGERESVAKFLDRYGDLNVANRESLKKAAAAIRAGQMPEWYQYQTMR